ncbi:MAG: RluA family pseudouridine synthase [Candidatus Omnitrophota bacterium]|jgi:23S rRNA pseudouridine1911/1915/1917 synthase
MQTFHVKESRPLLAFLLEALAGTPRTRIKEHLRLKRVAVNGKAVTQFDQPLETGDKVEVGARHGAPGRISPGFGIEILYDDDAVVVIHKPNGLLSVGSETVRHRTAIRAVNDYLNREASHADIRRRDRAIRSKMIFIVHRLDREASGLMVFAKTVEGKLFLQEHWHEFRKKYFAVVEGSPAEPEGTLSGYLKENKFLRVHSARKGPGARMAVTHYSTVRTNGRHSLLEVELGTGRKHQIRAQLAEAGHPVAGDDRYGAKTDPAGRLALHACRLEFCHPVTGAPMVFDSPLPETFKRIID